jgi:hypothetical protein
VATGRTLAACGTLAALGDVELHCLAFFQPATFLDGADVDEYVVTGLRLNEAVALVGSNHLTVPTGMLLALLRHLEASITRRQTPAASDQLDCAAQSNATGAGAKEHHAHRHPARPKPACAIGPRPHHVGCGQSPLASQLPIRRSDSNTLHLVNPDR